MKYILNTKNIMANSNSIPNEDSASIKDFSLFKKAINIPIENDKKMMMIIILIGIGNLFSFFI